MNVGKFHGHNLCSSEIVLVDRVFFVRVELMLLNAGISIRESNSCRVTNFLMYVAFFIQPFPTKKKNLKYLGLDKNLNLVDHSELDTFP